MAPPRGLPTVDSPTFSGVTTTSAVLSATLRADDGSLAGSRRGVVFALLSVNPTPTLGGPAVTPLNATGSGPGAFALSTTAAGSLVPNTNHVFRGYAANRRGVVYTAPVTFTTLPVVVPTNTPTLTPTPTNTATPTASPTPRGARGHQRSVNSWP